VKTKILAAVALLVLGVPLAVYAVRMNREERPLLRFDPDELDLSRTLYISGESIERVVHLKNDSTGPLVLMDMPKSCGCMTLFEGKESVLPMTLAPGAELPIQFRISTTGRVGLQEFALQAVYQSPTGRKHPKIWMGIKAAIISGIHAIPSAVYLEGETGRREPLEATVILADEWPEGGLRVREITTPADGRLKYELKPASGGVSIQGLDLQKRHELRLSYTPADGVKEFDELVTITPENTRAEPLKLRFQGRIKDPFEFQPGSLTVYDAGDGGSVDRVVEYRYSRPEDAEPKVASVPEGVRVEEMPPAAGVKRFKISLRPSAASPGTAREIRFRIGEGTRTVALPVIVAR
jgi:hypothetical protein